jgi:PCO_ADO
MGIFAMHRGATLPLHDHPGMHVLSRSAPFTLRAMTTGMAQPRLILVERRFGSLAECCMASCMSWGTTG